MLFELFFPDIGYCADNPSIKIEKLTIILDKVLEHGLGINAACGAGRSLLIEALSSKVLQKERVKLLIDRGADIYHVVSGVWDVLLHATAYATAETLRCILESAAKHPRAGHCIEIERWSPTGVGGDLDYICSCLDRHQLTETVFTYGSTTRADRGTMLQMAASQGNVALTSRLLQHSADINVRGRSS